MIRKAFDAIVAFVVGGFVFSVLAFAGMLVLVGAGFVLSGIYQLFLVPLFHALHSLIH